MMHELTINDEVFEFNFGLGFLRDMNKKVSVPVDGMPGVKQDIGLRYTVAKMIDGDVESLIDVLDTANKGCQKRITKAALDGYIEDEDTNIDEVFENVLGFLERANATKRVTKEIKEAAEKEKQKKEAMEQM